MNRLEEYEEKRGRALAFLGERGIEAALLSTRPNVSWYGCGADAHVLRTSDRAAATLVVAPSGDRLVASRIEAARLMEEELRGLPIEPVVVPWEDPAEPAAAIGRLLEGKKAASDDGAAGTALLPPEFARLRQVMVPAEVARLRALGREAGDAVERVARALEPGWTERGIAAEVTRELARTGADPCVLLIAADERIRLYRHPIPTGKPVLRCAMLVVCAERSGLVVSLTRLVHFGALPRDLRRRHEAVVRVDAAMIAATRVGASVGAILRTGIKAYAAEGYPEEWRLHHQGGAAGYLPREFIATPDDGRAVRANQPFAWNPSIAGTKSEDTVLATGGAPEVLTLPPTWPRREVEIAGATLPRPDILVR